MSETFIKRVRPKYDRARGFRTPDGAEIMREIPKLRRNGSKLCGCGRIISANKTKCAACAGVSR